jgi:hypothetical protein
VSSVSISAIENHRHAGWDLSHLEQRMIILAPIDGNLQNLKNCPNPLEALQSFNVHGARRTHGTGVVVDTVGGQLCVTL